MTEEVMFDIDKKWKYLQFPRENSPDEWRISLSDEPSGISRDRLLSASQIYLLLQISEDFQLVFNAVSWCPQLVECSDGLYEARQLFGASLRWKLFPVLFNRKTWKQMSHYVRHRIHWAGGKLFPADFCWMNEAQLNLARRLMIESLKIADVSAIDEVLVYKRKGK
jgi:hypothetical protein